MQNFPVRNIFLPATLVASAVFAAFTVPAALRQANNGLISTIPVLNRSAFMSPDRIHKDVAIPYIGTAIVLSAGAGIVTAELSRKRHAASQKTVLQQAEFDSFEDISVAPESAVFPISNPKFEWPTAETTDIAPSGENGFLDYNFPADMPEATWPEASTAKTPIETAQDADYTVVIFPGQYQRCRIQVSHLPEHLYAIEFDERFYSLLSAGIAKEQALAAIKQLNQEDRPAILTQMNQGYAVWVLEPQAQLVAVA